MNNFEKSSNQSYSYEKLNDEGALSTLSNKQRARLHDLRSNKIRLIVEANHKKRRLMWDPVRHKFINQSDYYRDLKPSDCKSYLIPKVLQAKKWFGKTPLFLEAITIYIEAILLYKHFINDDDISINLEKVYEIDKQYARYMEIIMFDTMKSQEEIIEEIFHHPFWSMLSHNFSFNKKP